MEVAVQDKSAERAKSAKLFEEMRRKDAERQAAVPKTRAEGVEALKRLLTVAQGKSGQCRHVAAFLLGLYNGNRFKFDLTDFRCLDYGLFEDCMAVLRMDFQPAREVHDYFENGNQIWEQLAKDWRIRDYTKKATA
jgi:sucrose-6-phosphate hydrolase SacC (GH32 family)